MQPSRWWRAAQAFVFFSFFSLNTRHPLGERLLWTHFYYRLCTERWQRRAASGGSTVAAGQLTVGQLRRLTKTSVARVELEKAIECLGYHAANHRQQSFCIYNEFAVFVVLLFKLQSTEALECTTLQRHELLDAGFLVECEAQYLHTHVFNE